MSYLNSLQGVLSPSLPIYAILAVTLNCNSRCVMCHLWENDLTHELLPREYQALPPTLRKINITGGEPFLRKDLSEIVEVVRSRCPQSEIILSTNGFLTDRIVSTMEEIRKRHREVGVRISIDGIGDKHDEVRGIKGGYQRCLETIRQLQKMGIDNLGIGYVILNRNIGEAMRVYQLAKTLKIGFTMLPPFDVPYFYKVSTETLRAKIKDLQSVLNQLVTLRYSSFKLTDWFYGWYEQGIYQYVSTGQRRIPCTAGQRFFFLDSQGNMTICPFVPIQVGSIRKQPWEEIWNSPPAEKGRNHASQCNQCWASSSIQTAHPRDFFKLAAQSTLNKLKFHF